MGFSFHKSGSPLTLKGLWHKSEVTRFPRLRASQISKSKLSWPHRTVVVSLHCGASYLGSISCSPRKYRFEVGTTVSLSSSICKMRKHNSTFGTCLVVQWLLRLCLSMPGILVQSLVGEVRSNMPHCQKTKTENRNDNVTNSIKTLKKNSSTSKYSLSSSCVPGTAPHKKTTENKPANNPVLEMVNSWKGGSLAQSDCSRWPRRTIFMETWHKEEAWNQLSVPRA